MFASYLYKLMNLISTYTVSIYGMMLEIVEIV